MPARRQQRKRDAVKRKKPKLKLNRAAHRKMRQRHLDHELRVASKQDQQDRLERQAHEQATQESRRLGGHKPSPLRTAVPVIVAPAKPPPMTDDERELLGYAR